jgi:hypothetical protein
MERRLRIDWIVDDVRERTAYGPTLGAGTPVRPSHQGDHWRSLELAGTP